MPKFRVHKHNAKRAGLHYDLRLEKDGKAKSWAVTKSIPLKPGTKRLAIQTPDHDLEWVTTIDHMKIESGYGQGVITTWDKGNYDIITWSPKVIVIVFHGKKLKGKYNLVRISFWYNGKSKNKKQSNWLFFKSKS